MEEIGKEELEQHVETLRQSYLNKTGAQAVFISATNKTNLEELKALLKEEVEKVTAKMRHFTF